MVFAAVAPAAAQQSPAAPSAAAEAPAPAPRLDPTQRLFDAVQANDYAAAQASVAAGADVAARDRWGLTPIELAIDKGYFELAHFLLSVRNFQREESERGASTQARRGSPDSRFSLPGALTGERDARSTAPARQDTSQKAQRRTEVETKSRVTVTPWPKGKPNPFDPNVPAPGTVLPEIGSSRLSGDTAAAGNP